MPRTSEKLVTLHHAAEHLGIGVDTIRLWAKKGLVRSHRNTENHRLFNLSELLATQKKSKGGPGGTYQILKAKSVSPHRAIELFSGSGGMALGFENAGIRSDLLVEWDKNACATLRKNWPHKNIIEGDVSSVPFTEYAGKIDIVAGGFPCQAFSYAGQSRGFADTRGTLFFEFARCVHEVRPKIALGENVRGLLSHDRGRTLDTMLKSMDELGYRTAVRVLRAQFHDVPQKRERLILLAIRKDLDLPFLFPKEKSDTVTLRAALKNVPDSPGQSYPEKKRHVMDLVPEGGNWRDLPESLQREFMGASFFLGGGRTGMARRMAWDEPSLTLTCSPAQKQTERCHPELTRPFTVREYARIQTFPDTWQFTGSISSQYKQIGNAVPVNLAYHLASALRHTLDGKFENADYEKVIAGSI